MLKIYLLEVTGYQQEKAVIRFSKEFMSKPKESEIKEVLIADFPLETKDGLVMVAELREIYTLVF